MNKLKRFFSLITAAFIILSNFTALSAAVTCKPTVNSYTLKDTVNMTLTRIEQNDVANLSIDITDNLIKTNEITSSDAITISSVSGCFGSADANSVDITSTGSNPLKYTINFNNVTYTGSGSTMTFKVKYTGLNLISDTITLSIIECSENVPNSDDTLDSTSTKQPFVEISRGEIPTISSGDEFTLPLIIKNRGGAKMKRPVLTISLPDSLDALEPMGNIQIPDIEAGTSRNITLKLRGSDTIPSTSEEIDLSLNYFYDSTDGSQTTGSYTDRIFVPMVSTVTASTPVVQITRGTLSKPISPDTAFTLPITVKNMGSTTISTPLLSFTLSEDLILVDDNSSTSLADIKAGESANYILNLKTKKYITSSTQEITAELKYTYKSANETTQGDTSTKLVIPTTPNDSEGTAPLLQIVPNNIEKPLKSNKSFSVDVTIKNLSQTDINTAVLTWDSGEGVILTGKSTSVNIDTLKAGKSTTVTLKGKTNSKLATTAQTITGTLKYKYESAKSVEQGEESIKVVIPTEPDEEEAKKLQSATPNIIIDNYNYGGVPIANGNKFNFDVTFRNTSKTTPIENIVMSMETDTGLSISSASNTYYFEKLSAQGKNSQSVEMQVLPTAETSSVKLTINFSYEYVENEERKQVTSTQNVSIPIYKPDKLEITLDPLSVATVGMEQTVTLNYVNKGKGTLSNVAAEIVGDIATLTSTQNLGNFESGKSGTINFVVIPSEAGEVNFTVKVSYEDANSEQKVLEFPCTMTVEDEVIYDDYEEPTVEEEGMSTTTKIIIGSCVGIVLLIIIIIIVRKIIKKKKSASTVSVNWEDNDEDQGFN